MNEEWRKKLRMKLKSFDIRHKIWLKREMLILILLGIGNNDNTSLFWNFHLYKRHLNIDIMIYILVNLCVQ